uniref:Uncharacterized protein n=1 Tax=Cucumis melo TaxID=3656 RepID=A0A9I9E309_CUCME
MWPYFFSLEGGSVERRFRSRGITEFQVRVFLLLDPESRLKPYVPYGYVHPSGALD